jgi:hypothetical protein
LPQARRRNGDELPPAATGVHRPFAGRAPPSLPAPSPCRPKFSLSYRRCPALASRFTSPGCPDSDSAPFGPPIGEKTGQRAPRVPRLASRFAAHLYVKRPMKCAAPRPAETTAYCVRQP